jgi:MarR family transcriptional regulator, organic hydroperoxide resistance regulator
MPSADWSVPFLMHQIASQVMASVNRHARAYGLKFEGVRALYRLMQKDGRPVGELARLTGIELSTLSRVVSRMEARGLVRRVRNEKDAREVIVFITPKGRALAQQERPVYFRDYEKILLAGMSPRENEALRESLGRMLENLNHRAEPESSERVPVKTAIRSA